jgi:serine beta-lactamase-like protein LACTB
MKRIVILFLVICFSFSLKASDSLTIAQVKEKVQAFFDTNGLPGLSITIARKGQIVLSEGFGYSDLENMVPVDPASSKFRIGSVSKPFTAAALAVLYEQGKIDLDTAIQTYVPSFPKKGRKKNVTLRLTAGHLAGIRHYKNGEFLSAKNYPTVEEGLKIFKDDSLLHAPGKKYAYSSYGWNLISAAIETAAADDFLSFMRTVVFDSLGMTNTVADRNDWIVKGRTRFYVRDFYGNIINAPYVDNSYKWAGGGFLSTTEDLIKFAEAHMKEGYLKQETLDLFFASQKTDSGEVTNYGIGWTTYPMDDGRKFYGHGGGSVGGSTAFIFDPEEEVVVAIVSNMSSVNYGMLAFELLEMFQAKP